MNPTKKEIDQVSGQFGWLKRVVDFLVPLVRPLWRIGFVRRAAGRSVGGRLGAIARVVRRGEHEKAVSLAMEALRLDEYRHGRPRRFRPSDQDFWWTFLTAALYSLRELDDPEKWDEAIALAEGGVEPFQGYEVAQCFLAFARWKCRAGEYDAALDFAERAARADDTWAEPAFFLGWYRLALGGGDAMVHLTAAVTRDNGILFRIARDPVCRRHPHLIERLKELVATEGVAGPEADDAAGRAGAD